MNLFTTWDGKTDWNMIVFTFCMGVLGILIFTVMVTAIQVTNQRLEEQKSFKVKCIEAGGSPVSPFEYVRGHGEGYLCINPSAIIEVN